MSEQEGEQDLVPGMGGGVIDDWHPFGGKELVGDLLDTVVKIDPKGLLIVSIHVLISIVRARLYSLLRSFCKTGTDDSCGVSPDSLEDEAGQRLLKLS